MATTNDAGATTAVSDRRTLLKRGAALGAAAYVAPQIISMSPAGAATLGCHAVRITRGTTSTCANEPSGGGLISDNSCDPDLTATPYLRCTLPAANDAPCTGAGMSFANFGANGIQVTLEAGCVTKFANVKTGGPGSLCSNVSGPGTASNANGSITVSGQTITADSTNHGVSHMIVAWCCASGSASPCQVMT